MSLRSFLFLGVLVSLIVALIIGIYRIYKTEDRLVKLVFAFVVFSALVEGAGYITASLKINNLWLSHLYIPIEYALLSLIFFFYLPDPKIRKAIIVSVILFWLFCIIDALFIESIMRFNSYPRILESALLIGMSLMYLYKVFNDLDKLHLERDPMFLLSAGIIIYYAAGVTLNAVLSQVIERSHDDAIILLRVMTVLNIFSYIMFTAVMWRAPDK